MVNSAQPLVNDAAPMLDVALSYQAQSWPVFPCRHRDEEIIDPQTGEIEILATKTPLTSNGFRGATLNERIVREYWRRNPSAMIGVPTGAPIGAWVLDIDPKHGGDETLAALEAQHGALPATLTAETTSGGRHYFFRHRQGVRNRGALGSGVDVRGDGGYVIAAGSVPDNLAPLSHRVDWRKLESVALGNGQGLTKPQDHTPVVISWVWPTSEEVAETITEDEREAIRGVVNGGMYKPAPQAKDWVGRAVAYALQLDIDEDTDKKRVSMITKALFAEGFLMKVEDRDPVQRRATTFVRAM
ncbi:bifunctional DNA primase/polymerase, N-terminal family protein (plasmid) [Ochrobactrum quorumnocens]|uniref:Bifunctional DNA primase/polymerase, N-terminal family protein n=1 Tax=Ochrobactrum quorumnocens TaxID=271865 RepID=A0A248U8I6_9HYPH|nr:bifunctional DNA primase/polymerase [[Ochrobactrum] quorumnocens]ASV83025.1 bifunctional DNA primase/polymerase, N-terminal family protein [[Ochrobactrum] quorumnocens]